MKPSSGNSNPRNFNEPCSKQPKVFPGSRKLVWRRFAGGNQELSPSGDFFLLFPVCKAEQGICSLLLPKIVANQPWAHPPLLLRTSASPKPSSSHCFSPVQLLPWLKFMSQSWEWWEPFGMQFTLTAITFPGLEEWNSCCHSQLRAYFLTVKQVTFLWPAKKAFAFLLYLVILQLSNPPCFMGY